MTGANGFVGRALSRRAARRWLSRSTGLVRTARCLRTTRRRSARVIPLDAVDAGHASKGCIGGDSSRGPRARDARRRRRPARRIPRGQCRRHAATSRDAAQEAGRAALRVREQYQGAGRNRPGPAAEGNRRTPSAGSLRRLQSRSRSAARRDFGARTGLEIVIVRPPLVYGPHVRANFLSLMQAIAKGLPLPFGAVQARRSLCFVDNLASALALCAIASARRRGRCSMSPTATIRRVAELARALGRHLGRPARLLRCPGRPPASRRQADRQARADRPSDGQPAGGFVAYPHGARLAGAGHARRRPCRDGGVVSHGPPNLITPTHA